MLKQLTAALLVVAFSANAMAEVDFLQPRIGAQFNLGGPEHHRRFDLHLSLRAPVLDELAEQSGGLGHFRVLSYLSSTKEGAVLHFMGKPVAALSQPNYNEYLLRQNQDSADSSNWFGRNWWVVGLALLAVGVAVASGIGGGGGGGDDAEPNQNSGCTTVGNGDVVGPRSPPTVDSSCL